MKVRTIGAACVLLFSTAALFAAESIPWRKDLTEAQEESKRTGRPMMVDVFTDWCSWCKKLDSDTYSDAKVIAKSRDFVALKLNPERSDGEAKFAERYGVSGYPTILFLEPDGSLINRIGGYLPAEPFADAMAKTLDYRTKIRDYLAEFKAGTNKNAEALLSMLLETGRAGEARPVFDKLQKDAKWDAARRGSAALQIATSLLDGAEYKAALDYIRIVEDLGPKAEGGLQARLMHAVAFYYTAGKKQALEFLDGVLKDRNTPKDWAAQLSDLRKRVSDSKDPGKN
jgi:thioredoxin-related protein